MTIRNLGETRVWAPVLALFAFALLWKLAISFWSISPLILPEPEAVLRVLVDRPVYLLTHAGITLAESVLGFLLGSAAGLLLALIFQLSRFLERAVYPYAVLLKAIPLVALAPLVVVWFGTGITSKVVLAGIISFFPVLVNAIQGLGSLDEEAEALMSTMSATKLELLFKLRIPNAIPSIFAGFRVSSSFAVVGAVVAEFVGSQSGIGYVIKSSSYYLDTDLTFAGIVLAGIGGLAFFGIIVWLEGKLVYWLPGRRGGSSR